MQPGRTPPQLPIGYWLKHTDEVITVRINQTLASQGFTRFQWQVLNSLYEGESLSKETLFDTMQTFLTAPQLDAILHAFMQTGWLVKEEEGTSTTFFLTDSGRMERDRLFALQSNVRKQSVQGITEQEYALVIEVLQRMVSNLTQQAPSS